MKYEITQIGLIRSPYKTKSECPIQGAAAPEGIGRIEIFPQFSQGLKSIERFSHLFLIFVFDRAGDTILTGKPFLDDEERGVFAMRHPRRPNSLGLSVVRLVERRGSELVVAEIDVLDGTPLIDIKPYVPRFDARECAGSGWLADKEFREKPPNRE